MPVGNAILGKGEKFYRGSYSASQRQRFSTVLNYLKVRKNAPQFPPFSAGSGGSPLLEGLVAHWNFESATGTRTFDSVGTNPLVDASVDGFPVAKFNNGVRIVPQTALFEENLNTAFNTPTEFTVSFWFKLNVATAGINTPTIIAKLDVGSGFIMVTNSSRNIAVNVYKAGVPHSMNPAGTTTVGTFYFFVIRHKAGNNTSSLFWYSEGALISQTDSVGDYGPGTTVKLQVGNNNSPLEVALDITIDHLDFWNRGLSDGEINSLWNNGAGKTFPY